MKKKFFRFPTVVVYLLWILFLGVEINPLVAAPPVQKSIPDARRERPEKFIKPALIQFNGEIDFEMARYFNNRLQQAQRDGIDCLIIEIDSPGGLKIESLQMARALRDCKWAYTVALITNQAISGGALVSLGCDEIFIDPNAKFGDIGEIGFDAEASAWRLIEPKIESYLSRDARDLAESKGRPADLAEAMVDKDVLVYLKPKPADDQPAIAEADARNLKVEFKSVRADDPNPPAAPWQLIPETGRERFLTLSGQRAKELGIAQHFATDRAGLAKELGIEIPEIKVYRHTTTDTLVHWLNNSFITGLLVVIGLIALYIELSAPGTGAGGLIAGLCATLFFWSRFLGGTAGWLEVILFVAGVTFLLMEIFVIPGFGISGLTGIVLLFLSVVLASQNFTWPQTPAQWSQTVTTTLVLLCSGCVFLIAVAFISKRLGSIPVFNRLMLDPQHLATTEMGNLKDDAGKPIPQPHPLISVGDWGRAESLLRPAGRAKFAGRSFDVISDGSFVDPGIQVKVIRINGNLITVAPIEDDELDQTKYRSV